MKPKRFIKNKANLNELQIQRKTGRRTAALSQLRQARTILAYLALAALGAIAVLAFIAPSVSLPDRIVLLPLGLAALSFWIPYFWHRVGTHREVAAFILTAAMFLLYSLARSAGPDEGFQLSLAALPDDSFVVPYSAYIVFFSALITGAFWRHQNDWTRSAITAILIIGLLALASFTLLFQYFPSGPTEVLDPSPFPTLAMKLLEYGCLALLCDTVTAHKATRHLALRLLPGVLLLLWVRHQFFVAPVESESG